MEFEIYFFNKNELCTNYLVRQLHGKYLYPKETLDEIKEFFTNEFNDLFPNKLVKYII